MQKPNGEKNTYGGTTRIKTLTWQFPSEKGYSMRKKMP